MIYRDFFLHLLYFKSILHMIRPCILDKTSIYRDIMQHVSLCHRRDFMEKKKDVYWDKAQKVTSLIFTQLFLYIFVF